MSYFVRPGVHAQEPLGGLLSGITGGIGGAIGSTIGKVGGKAAGGVASVGERVKGVVCQTVRTPGAAQGAVMASGGVGALAVVGTSTVCGPAQAPMPFFPPPSDLMMPLLLGGMAIAIIFVVTQPKKKAPTP